MSLIPQKALDSHDLLGCKATCLRIAPIGGKLPGLRRGGDRFSDCGDIHLDGNMVKLYQLEGE